jgi:hypothetical protein
VEKGTGPFSTGGVWKKSVPFLSILLLLNREFLNVTPTMPADSLNRRSQICPKSRRATTKLFLRDPLPGGLRTLDHRKQRSLPRNRGWVAWGESFDRDNGSAYAGYLNQEYDPATALFIRHARTGDAEALAYVSENYGKSAARAVVKIQKGMSVKGRAALETSLSNQLGYTLVHDSLNEAKKDGAFIARLQRQYGSRREKMLSAA